MSAIQGTRTLVRAPIVPTFVVSNSQIVTHVIRRVVSLSVSSGDLCERLEPLTQVHYEIDRLDQVDDRRPRRE